MYEATRHKHDPPNSSPSANARFQNPHLILGDQDRIDDAFLPRGTDIIPVQLLVLGSRRSTLVFGSLRYAKDLLLARIRVRVLLIAPSTTKVQPIDRPPGFGGRKGLGAGVIGVGGRGKSGVPELAFVAVVVEDKAEWKIETGDGVIVRSIGIIS